MKKTVFWISCLAVVVIGLGAGLAWWQNRQKVSEPPKPPSVAQVLKEDYYSAQIQPILSGRCVACHACYNAPCQLNLTSYDGIQRGASKSNPYDFPLLEAQPPTRLGIDAHGEIAWRKKGFFSVLSRASNEDASLERSMLWQLVQLKNGEPQRDHEYHAEASRTCPNESEGNEVRDYISKMTYAGMPYGLPELSTDARATLGGWITKGAPGPTKEALSYLRSPSDEKLRTEIAGWERLLNEASAKQVLSARYFFEHLFIAHIYFASHDQEFFRLVRARNREGWPEEIATVRPYDDAREKFYYRFQKVDQVIVSKTHTVFRLSPEKKKSFEDDFINSNWSINEKDLPRYGASGANPLVTFQAIPRASRYRFFLDEARYFIMTFMKGPVCRGQAALNVINDHFWVMFLDPKADLSVTDDADFDRLDKLMTPPAVKKDNLGLFNDLRERRWQATVSKMNLYAKKKVALDLNSIWDGGGENPNALLTVYRHFDSSNVLWGAVGEVPKTVWVIDYQIFEDIYYNLVAGYDVFGPVAHQLNTRLYMEISRISSEDLFLSFMPKAMRSKMRSTWSMDRKPKKFSVEQTALKLFGLDASTKMTKTYPFAGEKIASQVDLKSDDPQAEFLHLIFEKRLNAKVRGEDDVVNRRDLGSPENKSNLQKADLAIDRALGGPERRIRELFRPISGLPGKFAQVFPDVAFIRVRMPDGNDLAYSAVHNKEHYNVSLVFFEDLRRRPEKDTLNFVSGFAADYPNFYFDLPYDQLENFVKDALALTGDERSFDKFAAKYGVSRHSPKFWDLHDWFNGKYKKLEPVEGGLFDLNRYASH